MVFFCFGFVTSMALDLVSQIRLPRDISLLCSLINPGVPIHINTIIYIVHLSLSNMLYSDSLQDYRIFWADFYTLGSPVFKICMLQTGKVFQNNSDADTELFVLDCISWNICRRYIIPLKAFIIW